ncbi:unnamed protein product [Thelazia callipaeda]|uniref:Aminopeptidase n=1 Tax=Thelazia callipaeda TaxID=103827 RepID=A0A0N5D4K3_THECL|nr:unnamed protein product [Thelazia callipaeda]
MRKSFFFCSFHDKNYHYESNKTCSAVSTSQTRVSVHRLPKSLHPVRYILQVKVYLPGYSTVVNTKTDTFEINVTVEFRAQSPTDRIILNADKLHFESYQLLAGNETNQITSITINHAQQTVIFETNEILRVGKLYAIQMKCSGKLGKLSGLYMTEYRDATGGKRYMAITQMQPTDARKLLPCFDEPEFKAIWNVTVIHPHGTIALSNGLELKTSVHGNDSQWVCTYFEETLPMSSYLLAIAVTDFEHLEAKTKRGIQFRIWSRREALNQTKYALELGVKSIEFFENYYGIPFPLRKQDMIAVPDFAAGAMENWGLITFSELALLYDSRLYSRDQKLYIAITIAHELAHQWFGNLVTMKWWDDLWLNEGFATFMQYLGASAATDGNIPRGSSFLYMTEQVLGPESFKNGTNIYLKHFEYRNADHSNLWDAFHEAYSANSAKNSSAYFNIKQFSSSWITQVGYPVINVQRLDSETVELRQKRFLYGQESRLIDESHVYSIPLWYQINDAAQPLQWLHHEFRNLSVPESSLFVLNTLARGFYRVNYDLPNWLKITKQLITDHKALNVRTRSMIIDDAFALAEGGMLNYEVTLNITRYLRYEEEYLPWSKAFAGFDRIARYFGNEPEFRYMKVRRTNFSENCKYKISIALHCRTKLTKPFSIQYMEYLLAPIFNSVNWTALESNNQIDSNVLKNLLKEHAVAHSCRIGTQRCIDKLQNYFTNSFLNACTNTTLMSSECSVRHGSIDLWKMLFDFYKKERAQVEQHFLLLALSCTSDTTILKV